MTRQTPRSRRTAPPVAHADLYDFDPAEVTYSRIGRGMRSDSAYAVDYRGTFLGYVVGRDGGWSTQPESDPNVPVLPTHEFLYAYPTRSYATDLLVAEARTAGVVA
jgi:hypothetical protein